MDRFCGGETAPLLSLTITLNVAVLAIEEFGVPLINPAVASRVNPDGSAPELITQLL
jgi:hypothetical protein